MEQKQPSQPLTDLSAHEHAMSLPMSEVVGELVALLGATTVAVIGGVTETRAVQQWTAGREPQRGHVLRFALQIARMIAGVDGDNETVRAWFGGSNPRLGDAIPALLLRSEPLEKVQAPLMKAARAFAGR
ncbi:MAG TPA: hypothetical protein VFN37_14800 [Candidatus Baltobacteraceae bacterium]|nr:hypothetical protein [Candidatus Baltobacteraceae bacterium]